MKSLFTIVFLFMSIAAIAQKINTRFLPRLLKSHPEYFKGVLAHPQHNEIQILYTQINRDEQNLPRFKSYGYRLDAQRYFYPASTVKLPASVFALEKINRLNVAGLTKETPLKIDSIRAGQSAVTADSTAQNGLPSIAHYIKKILLTSDNDAFNRLFEFLGREEINRKLKENGLTHSRILNRLAIGDGGEASRHTNPFTFFEGDKILYSQEAQYDAKDYPLELNNLLRGKAYMDANDNLVNKPFSFADKNVYTIANQQALMKKLLFPEIYPETERFDLKPDDYTLIYKYMSMYPAESDYPAYDPKEFWPTYSKFIYYGREKNAVIDPNIRIFNKYGDSYGYVIDNAYVVDFKNGVEFLLTAVVQSNEDEIYNDNNYEYETVCYPFLKNLGRVIYEHELKRKKKRLPDLSKFQFEY